MIPQRKWREMLWCNKVSFFVLLTPRFMFSAVGSFFGGRVDI